MDSFRKNKWFQKIITCQAAVLLPARS